MNIVIATGGSGGHLFPALQVARELKKKGHHVFFVGAFYVGKEQIEKAGFPFQELQVKGLRKGKPLQNARAVFLFIKAFVRSCQVLRKYKTDVVAGFGGYGAFSVVLAAVFLRYPTLIHEQNVVPGKANALLAKFVRRIAVSFPQTLGYFDKKKTVLTGCPSHLPMAGVDREKVFKRFPLDPRRKTILVFGGSQGSRRINEEFMKSAEILKGVLDFQVVHICGKADYRGLADRYARLGIPFALFEFLEDIDDAYQAADLVISRAGAVTVTELALFLKPSILIPYPYAHGHQKKNAEILSEANLGRMIEEKDLTPEVLKDMILDMLRDPLDMARGKNRLREHFVVNAGQNLATEVAGLRT
jgi:UDP-N-acetylglucosamine--N-acetylmuramyl-(pentapeptide) pyrophosphoryl-undecaprenol N-acetylglucosamine transferase